MSKDQEKDNGAACAGCSIILGIIFIILGLSWGWENAFYAVEFFFSGLIRAFG